MGTDPFLCIGNRIGSPINNRHPAHHCIHIVIPRPSSLKFQKPSLSYSISSIWNDLPSSITSIQSPTSFNTHLKSYISYI